MRVTRVMRVTKEDGCFNASCPKLSVMFNHADVCAIWWRAEHPHQHACFDDGGEAWRRPHQLRALQDGIWRTVYHSRRCADYGGTWKRSHRLRGLHVEVYEKKC